MFAISNSILNIKDTDGNGYYDVNDFLNMKNEEILEMNNGKKFSVIIQNPPYAGSLHLKFLEKCIEIGEKVVSIQPATFLINTRKDGKAKTQYILLKNKLEL